MNSKPVLLLSFFLTFYLFLPVIFSKSTECRRCQALNALAWVSLYSQHRVHPLSLLIGKDNCSSKLNENTV